MIDAKDGCTPNSRMRFQQNRKNIILKLNWEKKTFWLKKPSKNKPKVILNPAVA